MLRITPSVGVDFKFRGALTVKRLLEFCGSMPLVLMAAFEPTAPIFGAFECARAPHKREVTIPIVRLCGPRLLIHLLTLAIFRQT